MSKLDSGKNNPLWDSGLALEERLNYLIDQLTTDEKFKCLTTGCPDIPRLLIKAFSLGGEAAHGIEARHDQAFNAGEAEETTSFPQPIGMSATWDAELIYKAGEAVGTEARVLYERHLDGGLCRWAPTVDMERDPRWGRTEEAYGEDPFLTGKMASAYIRGMRGEDPFYLRCGATLKHFYANNKEENRVADSSSIDPRNQYEYYLEPFRRCIMEGGAEAVMTAYNEINGVPCIVNPEVQELLKERYGLPGHVVCDGGDMQQTVINHGYYSSHAETVAYGLKAGVDCFTDDREVVEAAAREALERGLITMEEIDRSIRNSFSTRIRLGLYDGTGECPYHGINPNLINSKEHGQLAFQAAQEAVVLLKNEGGILPLEKESGKQIAVIGPLADVWYKDWYCPVPPYEKTLLHGIQERYSLPITFCDGYDTVLLACENYYVGLDQAQNLILTNRNAAEEFRLEDWGNGTVLLFAKSVSCYVKADDERGCLAAVSKEAFAWFIKEAFDLVPLKKGKGAITIQTWDDKEIYKDVTGKLMIGATKSATPVFVKEIIHDGTKEAIALAKEADIVIAAIGCNPVINSKEEIDRTDLQLPPSQEMLLKKLYEANEKTVMVLISNYPYTINWEQESLPAICWSATGSQEMGSAIASVLFGEASPAGRLNMTWYKTELDLPPMDDYDIIRGKRTYQYFDKPVLYPFGYGLSYSTFCYENYQVVLSEDRNIRISLELINTGSVTADEVVQIYVHQENSRALRPIRQLKAFERIKAVGVGDRRSIMMTIPISELQYYDVISGRMILEQSKYRIMAGASSHDIRVETVIAVPGRTIHKRDAFQYSYADHFDDCEGIRLYRGHNQDTGIYVSKTAKKGKLVYKDMLFTQNAVNCCLDLHEKSTGTIKIMADGILVGSYICSGTEGNRIVCPINDKMQPSDNGCNIEITLEGTMGIIGFLFQGDKYDAE